MPRANLGQSCQLFLCETLSRRVVWRVDDNNLGLWRERLFELFQIKLPVGSLRLALRHLGRVQWHVDGFASVENDTGEVLIEKGLDTDDLVVLL